MSGNIEILQARSAYYGWLAALFGYVKDEKIVENISLSLDILATNPIEEKSAKSLENMQDFLKEKGFNALCEENNEVFYSIATTLIPVTASYYDEGRDDGKKRVEMADYFFKSTFRRDTSASNEPEDHVSLIFGLNSSLLRQAANGCKESEKLANEIFKEMINPFIDSFELALFTHESADFYKNVSVILNAFISFERFLLKVSKPEAKAVTKETIWQVAKDRKPFVERVKRNLDEIQL
ncbi:MAG: molecular chaperone TorD family protein [Campylobacterales bacterium]|nr:molecular chaperone TorD family protein [Campylobacterales bacterium]